MIIHAVSGMLPKNSLREIRVSRLKVFPEMEHPHEASIFEKLELPKRQDTLRILPRQRREMTAGISLVEELTKKGLRGEGKDGIPLTEWTKLNAAQRK